MAATLTAPVLYLVAETKGSFYRHFTTTARRGAGSTTALCGLKDIGVPSQATATGGSRTIALEIVSDCNEVGLLFCPFCTEAVEAGAS